MHISPVNARVTHRLCPLPDNVTTTLAANINSIGLSLLASMHPGQGFIIQGVHKVSYKFNLLQRQLRRYFNWTFLLLTVFFVLFFFNKFNLGLF